MEFSADEVRQLRHRLGWSLAEMARCLSTDLETVGRWELGHSPPSSEHRNQLVNIMSQAESNSERIQRRPIAEVAMRERGLCQIHNFDLPESEILPHVSSPIKGN